MNTMGIVSFLGTQEARYLFVPILTVFLNWFIRLLVFKAKPAYEYSGKPLMGLDFSVSSFLLVLIDVSIYLSNHSVIPTTYGIKILFSIIISLLCVFAIVLVLRWDTHFQGRIITFFIGFVSIVISYFIMRE